MSNKLVDVIEPQCVPASFIEQILNEYYVNHSCPGKGSNPLGHPYHPMTVQVTDEKTKAEGDGTYPGHYTQD